MRIYIAGPYTLGDPIANVRAAIEAAEGNTPETVPEGAEVQLGMEM